VPIAIFAAIARTIAMNPASSAARTSKIWRRQRRIESQGGLRLGLVPPPERALEEVSLR